MAQDRRFSHITVNAADDDDVVIQAGTYGRHQGEDVLEEAVYAEPEPQVAPVMPDTACARRCLPGTMPPSRMPRTPASRKTVASYYVW